MLKFESLSAAWKDTRLKPLYEVSLNVLAAVPNPPRAREWVQIPPYE